MQQPTDGSLFDSTNLFIFLWKKRKPIIIASIIACIGAIVFSSEFFIPPKYKSSVILFPTTNSSISRSLISNLAFEKENILQFGEETEIEQMLQILNSEEIRERIISQFNLMSHYRIDSTQKYPRTRLNRKFSENISFNRTEYLSVRIDVLDENPEIAANIANTIAQLVDTVKTRMLHERAIDALAIVEKEYTEFQDYLQAREDTLNRLRSYGVLDYKSQVERLSEAYGKALMAGNSSATRAIEEKMAVLAKYGGLFIAIAQDMEHDRLMLNRLKMKYEEAKMDATEILAHKFVVDRATPAEKKSYPIRWLIVVISTVAAFLLSIIALLFIENLQRLRSVYTSA